MTETATTPNPDKERTTMISATKQVDQMRKLSGRATTRMPGHSMTLGGAVTDRPFGWKTGATVGATFCSCGVESPSLSSNAQRRAWHRQHKIDVLAASS